MGIYLGLTVGRYRSRNVFEAVLLDKKNLRRAAEWCGGEVVYCVGSGETNTDFRILVKIGSREDGLLCVVAQGMVLVKDEEGFFSALDPEEFEKAYIVTERGPSIHDYEKVGIG